MSKSILLIAVALLTQSAVHAQVSGVLDACKNENQRCTIRPNCTGKGPCPQWIRSGICRNGKCVSGATPQESSSCQEGQSCVIKPSCAPGRACPMYVMAGICKDGTCVPKTITNE